MRRLALLALPLTLAACGDAPGDGNEVETTDAAEPMEEATLDLEASGLVVPPQNGFERLEVPFGSNRAATEATLANILGEPTGTGAGDGDCRLQTTSYSGMTLNFEDDQFVGYTASAPYVPELTRAQMLEDPAVELVEDSTLGEEFFIGDPQVPGIAGLFSGADEDATVETLWAGENCIFR